MQSFVSLALDQSNEEDEELARLLEAFGFEEDEDEIFIASIAIVKKVFYLQTQKNTKNYAKDILLDL